MLCDTLAELMLELVMSNELLIMLLVYEFPWVFLCVILSNHRGKEFETWFADRL